MGKVSINSLEFGRVYGVNNLIVEDDNTEFTDYVTENFERLIKYASRLNIDVSKAQDLISDVWISYKNNEENGKGFDMSKGHSLIQTVEESVKARIKCYAKNVRYHRATSNSTEVLAHFTDDTEDDGPQSKYTAMASCEDIQGVLFEEEYDLEESMAYFVCCTSKCKISGLTLLEKIDLLASNAGMFDSRLLSDVWSANNAMKDCFRSAFKVWSRNPALYSSTLARVKEGMVCHN